MRRPVVGFIEQLLSLGNLYDRGDQKKGDDESQAETEKQLQVIHKTG